MNSSTSLQRILRSQAGVISRRQAMQSGMSPDQVDHRLATGEWIGVHPGVYRLASLVPSPESSLQAANLWLDGRAALTGSGAAWWWEMLPDPPTAWRFSTGQRFSVTPRPGIRVTRSFVDPFDITTRRGVPLVSRPLAVLQSAVDVECRRPGDGITLIDRTKQKRWVTQRDLEQAYERHRGTWGSRSMRLLLDRTGDHAHSQLERAGVRELRAAGITGFVVNHWTLLTSGRAVELDVAFLEQQVALEFDGYAYHSGPDQHRSDLRRANEIMASGWLLRRFAWSDVLADPDGFVGTVRASLDERSAIA